MLFSLFLPSTFAFLPPTSSDEPALNLSASNPSCQSHLTETLALFTSCQSTGDLEYRLNNFCKTNQCITKIQSSFASIPSSCPTDTPIATYNNSIQEFKFNVKELERFMLNVSELVCAVDDQGNICMSKQFVYRKQNPGIPVPFKVMCDADCVGKQLKFLDGKEMEGIRNELVKGWDVACPEGFVKTTSGANGITIGWFLVIIILLVGNS